MIFISYSSKDYKKACDVRDVLATNGIECWMAPESIPMGGDYSSEIPDAIESCELFLLVLSENSQHSNWVPKELDLALTYNRPILPFQIDDGILTKPFNFRLTNVQRIEAFHSLESAYDQLLNRIEASTGRKRSDLTTSELPNDYSYFQMLGINDISQLNVRRLREVADITSSLAVPIGINSKGETVCLDLHQRGDGPHGLVIGPSGSGKSEFLLTLCLSLCLFFSPEEVQIHVIDQKGGDIARELDGLPHLGKCLVSPASEDVNDFIASIDREVQRRFQLLEKHAVSNIYQYLKLRKGAEQPMAPMPHLVIAFDEMQTMKADYPEVLQKIKTWGSKMNATLLGIHIIFTTKFFAGLIDDSIWRMIDYRICSTMQRDEFTCMDEPDESQCPGRLYLQSRSRSTVQLLQLAHCRTSVEEENAAGYNWFFLGQSEKDEVIDLVMRHELD